MAGLNWKKLLLDKSLRRIYCCGITPYSQPHIGHLRVLSTAIMVKKLIGKEVKLAINWTDLDEKIMRLIRDNSILEKVCDIQVKRFSRVLSFFLDMGYIDFQPRVTDYVREIIDHIKILEGRKMVDIKQDGVYLKECEHDLLGHRTNGGFALWKRSGIGFETVYGRGIPGWHIECFCMINDIFNESVDLHIGGRDLIFPHHANEDLLSVKINAHPISRYWLHVGLINDEKARKMSKSIGNCVFLSDFKGREIQLKMYLHYFDPRSNIYYSERSFSNIVGLFNQILLRVRQSVWDQRNFNTLNKIRFVSAGYCWKFLTIGNVNKNLTTEVLRFLLPEYLISHNRYMLIRRYVSVRSVCRQRRMYDLNDRLRDILRYNYSIELIDSKTNTDFYLRI